MRVARAAIVLFAIPALACACTCQLDLSVCNEVAAGTLVFTGTVESVSPHLLDRWNMNRRNSMDELGAFHERYTRDGSPANLELRSCFPICPPTANSNSNPPLPTKLWFASSATCSIRVASSNSA